MPKSNPEALQAARAIVGRILAPGLAGRALRQRLREACAADGMPISAQGLHDWRKLKRGVPARRALIVAKVLKVSRAQVRPDLFARERHIPGGDRPDAKATLEPSAPEPANEGARR